jgi:hypothetical protein
MEEIKERLHRLRSDHRAEIDRPRPLEVLELGQLA